MAEFPIVGIGCSAGGLDALSTLFAGMPSDSGLAFIVAAHLDPTRESYLSELLGRSTKVSVVQIEAAVRVEPNHVYVIGPDQDLIIRDGVIHPQKPTAPRGHRHPIDSFFRSLAQDLGERAIAIVLSGTGTNGTLGLRFIKAEGGIAIAQLPETAAFEGMPRSAIGTGLVDLVLPPDQMPEALLGMARHTFARPPAQGIAETTPDEQLGDILAVVRKRTKHDFVSYKKQTLLRRIHRRMGLQRIERLPDYIERLRQDPQEVEALAGDLTINVTGFFRDPAAWQELDEKVLAPLVHDRPNGAVIRVWVPGCSTGEEAYSIAMLVAARAEAARKTLVLRIFATDLAQGMLISARAGLYPGSIANDIGAELLARYFEAEDDSYRINKPLRDMITFAPQNLLQDPPFSRMDLISCRNLLIYLKPEVQRKVLRLFHFALREDGHLFLGPAETASGHSDLFATLSKKACIYGRSGATRHDLVEFPLVLTGEPGTALDREAGTRPAGPSARAGELVDHVLLARYAPATVLIDRNYRVHYLRGPTGDYLQPASGEPSYNLIAMARQGLELALRRAVRTAIETNQETTADARVRRSTTSHPVRVVATPLRAERHGADRLLVSFFEREAASGPAPDTASQEGDSGESELQVELERTREDLRLTFEQMEASNEEFKASNEEIRSINEELRASNEELETSKEELQSLNEELNTVNNQLQAKVGELEARTDDLNNLLNSTEIATLFLDRDLCIRWFTPALKELFALRAPDLGRPAADFAQRFRGGDLLPDANRVLATLLPADCEVFTDDGRYYIRRIIPYRTGYDRIDGVVVTFSDVTERKQRERDVQAAREYAESIVATVRDPLLVLSPELIVRSANEPFYRNFHVNQAETIGRPIFTLGNGQWDIPELRQLLLEVVPKDNQFRDFEVAHNFEQIGPRTMLLNGRRLDHARLVLLAIEDITERKEAERAVRAEREYAESIVDTVRDPLLVLSPELTVRSANEPFYRNFQVNQAETIGRPIFTLGNGQWDIPALRQLLLEVVPKDNQFRDFEVAHNFEQIGPRTMLLNGRRLDHAQLILLAIEDITERKRAEAERDLLTRELEHRVKNTLAVVQSLAQQTTSRMHSIEDFREAFIGRLRALAQAHSLLLDAHWRSADLKALVTQTTEAYADDPDVIAIDGPPVALAPKQSLGLSLALHELGTNAAKYGALSRREGRLRIAWRIEPAETGSLLRLTWQERHGPRVAPPSSKGFGTDLIELVCSYELDGTAQLDYAPQGLTCEIVLPIDEAGRAEG
jgi:two-component system CheB/CheR fusion protein